MIKAGTSAKGCCPECGDPWARVTERTIGNDTSWAGVGAKNAEKIAQGMHGETNTLNRGSKADYYANQPHNVTTGWTPTCSHYDWEHCAVCGEEMGDYDKEHGDHLDCGHNICAECLMAGEAGDHVRECALAPVPCTVLDPFLGSGTTVEVADFLGRHSVGIELSKKYCDDHIIPRLTEPLFEWAEQEQQEPEPEIEQMELL